MLPIRIINSKIIPQEWSKRRTFPLRPAIQYTTVTSSSSTPICLYNKLLSERVTAIHLDDEFHDNRKSKLIVRVPQVHQSLCEQEINLIDFSIKVLYEIFDFFLFFYPYPIGADGILCVELMEQNRLNDFACFPAFICTNIKNLKNIEFIDKITWKLHQIHCLCFIYIRTLLLSISIIYIPQILYF